MENIWPDRLNIRDTGLYDDIGGAGQRIYTTAGQGYQKHEYVRADLPLTDTSKVQIEWLQAEVDNLKTRLARFNELHIPKLIEQLQVLNERLLKSRSLETD